MVYRLQKALQLSFEFFTPVRDAAQPLQRLGATRQPNSLVQVGKGLPISFLLQSWSCGQTVS